MSENGYTPLQAGVQKTPVVSINKITSVLAKTAIKLKMTPGGVLVSILVFLSALEAAGLISRSNLAAELEHMAEYFRRPVN